MSSCILQQTLGLPLWHHDWTQIVKFKWSAIQTGPYLAARGRVGIHTPLCFGTFRTVVYCILLSPVSCTPVAAHEEIKQS